jgi:hypothetical protein
VKRLIILKIVFLLLVGTCWAQDTEPSRRAQICAALKSHGYTGDMTAALKQAARDHGWQSKSVPDSRVLIWLGLGPHYSHLLNRATAWVATPQTVLLAKQ